MSSWKTVLATMSRLSPWWGPVVSASKTDWIVVDDGSGADRFVCTTSHPDEPLSDVIELVERWELEQGDPYHQVRL